MQKHNKFLKLSSILLVIIGILFYVFSFKNKSIDKVLEKKEYSYLSVNVKNYLKNYYEETGIVLKTEDNKEKNEPYLNPKYVEYLDSSDKTKYGYVPTATVIDYVYGTSPQSANYPSTYDLRNVNGKNFVTPVQNQFGGLCWAYSSTAQIESLILKNSNSSYSNSSIIFSERQLDYATSKNGIIDNKSLYPFRTLHDEGGVYSWPWDVEVDGLSLNSIDWEKDIKDTVNKLEPSRVYGFDKSLYEVDDTVVLPVLNLSELGSSNEDVALRKEYLDNIKNLVVNYGGAVVGTASPTGNCSIKMEDKNDRLIYDDNFCVGQAHAMLIVGWDDNYEYTLCQKGDYISENIIGCPNDKIIKRKGAWLIKNSWGDFYPYIHLAYDSKNSIISAVTQVDTKKWDNYYHLNFNNSTQKFDTSKNINSREKIKKIKINLNMYNNIKDTLDVYVSNSNNSFDLVGSIDTNLPGFYTLDVSDKNIILSDSNIAVNIKYKNNNLYLNSNIDIRLYTSNIDNITYIKSDDIMYDGSYSKTDNYIIRSNGITKNIPDGSIVTYKILDFNGEEIKYNYNFSENIVYANRLYSKINIDSNLPIGNYKLQTLYNNEVKSECNLNIKGKAVKIFGSGIKEDPYLIENTQQLNLIRTKSGSYFKFIKDIDLSYDTKDPNGLFYNEGKGFEPIKDFLGIIDFNNHKIIGLNINRPSEDYVGLFSNLSSRGIDNNSIDFSNVTFENPQIIGNNYVGVLSGRIDAASNIYDVLIKNIFVLGGSVHGNQYVGGIIGNLGLGVYYDNQTDRVVSLFNSSKVSGNNYIGGIIGNLENTHPSYDGMKVYVKNIINIGEVISDIKAGGLVGNVKLKHKDPVNIENAISVGKVTGKNCSNSITCPLDDLADGTLNLKNIYYLSDIGYDNTSQITNATNVKKMSFNEITNIDNYKSWKEFNTYFNIKTIDGINRMPILKNININYIKLNIDKLIIQNGSELDISDKIPNNQNIEFEIEDTNIAVLNENKIISKKVGKTNLIVTSNYEKLMLPLFVTSSEEYIINFDSNGAAGEINPIVSALNENTMLPLNSFIKNGYKFVNWNTHKDGSGNVYNPNESILNLVNENKTITLYAQWTPIKYKIIFNSNDNKYLQKEENFEYDTNKMLTPYSFENNTNFNFLYWNTSPDGSGKTYSDKENILNITTKDEDIINLYAIYNKYTVKFDPNGATGHMDDKIATIYNPKVSLIDTGDFKKPGYRLDHWIDNNTMFILKEYYIDRDLALKAQWMPVDIDTRFHVILNEDKDYVLANKSKFYVKSNIVKYNFEFEIFDSLKEFEGYKFVNWNTSPDGTGISYLPHQKVKNLSTGDSVYLYSIYKPIKYKIVYNSNDGNDIKNEQAVSYDESIQIKDNIFNKDEFIGWNTAPDGTGTMYKSMDSIKNLTNIENEIINLYAIFKNEFKYIINKYSVNENMKYIDKVDINTSVDDYKLNVKLSQGYTVIVNGVSINSISVLYTGAKTKIYKGNDLFKEYTNIIRGDVSGDGKINYLDYVSVYNHIQKTKNPSLDKKQLTGVFLIAADMSSDSKVNYLDYVNIYNKIKELKGEK